MKLGLDAQSKLMARVVQGDQAAFRELHDAVARQVYGFIRARSDNDADTSEISQETWLKFWKSLGNYDPARGNCMTFLRSIAYSSLVDYYRQRAKGQEVLISELLDRSIADDKGNELETYLGQIAPSAATVPPKGSDLLLERALLHAVFHGTSPPHQLVVFGFAELQGWNPNEITTTFSDVVLRLVEARLEKDYSSTSMLSTEIVKSCFEKLRKTMDNTLDDALQESRTRELYATLLPAIVGDTFLRQYYGDDPRQNISHWCQAVRRRVVSDSALLKDSPGVPVAARNLSDFRIEP